MSEKIRNSRFIRENRSKLIKLGVLLLLMLTASWVYFSDSGNGEGELIEETTDAAETEQEAEQPENVVVDITGAVKERKVVTLPAGSRVEDAIKECGGAAEDADLSAINRAAVLVDGQQIRIPTVDETAGGTVPAGDTSSVSAGSAGGLININTASEEELQQLTGVGPVTAEKIVAYRESYGMFRDIEGLKEVNGIGDKTFEKIKDHITV